MNKDAIINEAEAELYNSQNVDNLLVINNGINSVLPVNYEILKNLNVNTSSFHGIEFGLSKQTKIQKLLGLLKSNIVKTEKIYDRLIIYSYSFYFPKYVLSDGKKINFQICVGEEEIKLGYPILLGAY